MAEPTKYLRVVTDILALYQKELLRLFRKRTSFSIQTPPNSTHNSSLPSLPHSSVCAKLKSPNQSRMAFR